MNLFVIFSCGLLTVSLIAWIVQEDGLSEGNAFWRTRPVTAARLLTAKLTLLAALFIFLPLLAGICARFLGFEPGTVAFVTWLGDGVSFSISMTLSSAALAACSKNLAQFLFAGFLCIMFGFFWLLKVQNLANASSPLTFRLQWISQTHLSELLCAALALGVLLNQYFRRKLMVSIGLILVAVMGCPFILALMPSAADAHPLPQEHIEIQAMIVTKAELRRHMSAPENDHFRPATYAELAASRGAAQPDYLVVRFLTTVPGHFNGESEAFIDGSRHGYKFTSALHFNKGWVEYFFPLDGVIYADRNKHDGDPTLSGNSPNVSVNWSRLSQE